MNPNGGSNPTGNYGTMFSLGTVSGEDKEIQLKAEYPTIDEVIVEGDVYKRQSYKYNDLR